jgi:hypothetical protein
MKTQQRLIGFTTKETRILAYKLFAGQITIVTL